jgi:hypothetical protein
MAVYWRHGVRLPYKQVFVKGPYAAYPKPQKAKPVKGEPVEIRVSQRED